MNGATDTEVTERLIAMPVGERTIRGVLSLPRNAEGVVVFAHGTGSGRLSPRNQYVAGVLEEAGLGTLLIDLLEDEEAQERKTVFDIELLASRLQCASDWLKHDPETRGLRQGYFGASTGAAAALLAAARHPNRIGAVVSRSGRPDLAWNNLPDVAAPTLLIVGGEDDAVPWLNQKALSQLGCLKELVVIPGATHLFQEPGALEDVAYLAARWFGRHLTRGNPPLDPKLQFGPRFPTADMDLEC
jgi:putative phosphoribosyl transferase